VLFYVVESTLKFCPVEDTPLADFRAQIETNLFGVIIMTKAVLPYFRERRAGHIIQVTSIAGRIGPAGRAPYAAAKFGVEGFSESPALSPPEALNIRPSLAPLNCHTSVLYIASPFLHD
jgi:NAD(P)-dependent dehydrogenase (short-subunit alcohol dehydrogenase family)